MKKLIIVTLLIVASLSAKAFLPLGFAVFEVATAAGTTSISTASVGAGAWAALVGGTALWLGLATGDQEKVRVPLTFQPQSQPDAPSAPSSFPSQTMYTTSYCTLPPNLICTGAAGSGLPASSQGQSWENACQAAGGTGQVGSHWSMPCIGTTNKAIYATTQVTQCPAGYSMSGGVCALSNPKAVTPDDKCDYGYTSSAGFVSVFDVDCSGGGPRGVPQANGSLLVSGKDANGNLMLVTINPMPDGGTQTQIQIQTQDSGGNSVLQTQTINVNGSGQITGANQSSNYGNLGTNGSGDAYEPVINPNPQPQPEPQPQPQTNPDATSDMEKFCNEYPNAVICVNTGFSGDCASGPSCMGDPVQCATARASFQMWCQLSVQSSQHVLAQQVLAGADPVVLPKPADADANPIDISGQFDTSDWLPGACPAPVTASLLGQSVSLDVSPACPNLELVGSLLVGVTMIGCMYIVFGAVKG
jgi:hypothetical protein